MSKHKFVTGDVVRVFNTTFGGELVYEGKAVIEGALEVDDQYLVRFSNGDLCERFINFGSGQPLPLPFQQAVDVA